MIERCDFDHYPAEPERLVWCEWLRRHSADPNRVVVPGWIERRPDTYQLAYSALSPLVDGRSQLDEHGDVVLVTEVVQLEGPPLPFPEGWTP